MYVDELKYIPIDFLKAQIIGLNRETFENNPLLKNPKSVFNGELLTKTIYRFKNLTIKIYENNNRIEFTGSLHTYYNNGVHNYNDFTLTAFRMALKQLYLELGITASNLYIIHLEWGYNIKPPIETNYILERAIQHNSVNKTNGIDCPIEGKYIQFKHSTKILKAYNKGMHFKLPYEVFRIEIKQTNWSEHRLKGIVTLQDFIETDKSPFMNELLNQWQRIVLFDIKQSNEPKILQYQTTYFWNETRKNKSNKCFKYHFDKLDKLNTKFGLNTKKKIAELIIKKGNELQL